MHLILGYSFVVYLSGEKEHLAFSEKRLHDQTRKLSSSVFPTNLISFLDLNISEIKPLFQKLSDTLWSLTTTHDEKFADETLSILDDLSERHVYFQLLRLDWTLRISQAVAHGDYTEERLLRAALLQMPNYLTQLQGFTDKLFAHALDIDSGSGPALKRMAAYYAEDEDHFPFQPLPLGFDLVAPDTFAELLVPESVYQIIDYAARECVRREVRMRRCKNCGRWFAIMGRSTAEYCDRPADDRGRTCREVGAVRVWAKNKKGDTLFETYRREYKKRHARIRAGKLDAQELYAWGALAREKMAEVEAGKLTQDEFEAWLKQS